MLNIVANDIAELVQEDLTNNEDQHTERDMSKRPAIIQCVGNKKQLHGQVNGDRDSVEQVEHDKQTDCIVRSHGTPGLEGRQRDHE